MNGAWETVYTIASYRHHTKMGLNHLTDNELCILQGFVYAEKQLAMEKALEARQDFLTFILGE